MRSRDITIIVVCILIAFGLFVLGGTRLDYINSQRKEMGLIVNEPLKNAPPSLAFVTVAMGAFRGLVVDVLWMRAEKMKEEGQFFDAKQLAEWITALQPRFAAVWDFHSWNMAYNISAAIPATQPEERWRWVKNGYELIRDRGIELNPKSILLYRQMAFIFQHKIGGVSDEAHRYYKLQLALAMEPLLGPADNAYFEKLAKTPSGWQEIVSDGNVAEYVTKLRAADERFGDDDDFVGNYLSFLQKPARFNPDAFEVRDSYRGTGVLEKFDVFSRAYQLRKVWKLDPVLMEELNETYGPVDWRDPNSRLPLDWRHPDVHAIYWAIKGLRVAGKKGVGPGGEGKYSGDETNTDRMVVHSLQDLFRSGKIYIYSAVEKGPSEDSGEVKRLSQTIFVRPDLRMFKAYNQQIIKVIEKYTDPNDEELSSHQIGHRNMLKNAVFSFYQSGHKDEAQKIYDELRELYPGEESKVPLALFARKRFIEELTSLMIFNVREIVVMLLRESYFYYAMRDDDESYGRESLAQDVYDFYNSEFPEGERITLPEFGRLRYLALRDFLSDRQFPVSLQESLLGRIKIERPKLYEQLKREKAESMKVPAGPEA